MNYSNRTFATDYSVLNKVRARVPQGVDLGSYDTEINSVHIDLTNKHISEQLQMFMNGNTITFGNTTKYLGIILDTKHLKYKKAPEIKTPS